MAQEFVAVEHCLALQIVGIGLGLGPVDGFHGEGMAEVEGNLMFAAGIGEPVPGVNALASDGGAGEVGEGLEEGLRLGGQIAGEANGAEGIEDAEKKSPGMEIDAGIEWRLSLDEAHEETPEG